MNILQVRWVHLPETAGKSDITQLKKVYARTPILCRPCIWSDMTFSKLFPCPVSEWRTGRSWKGRKSNAILFITTVEELFPRQAYLPSWIVVKEGQSIPNCSTQKTTLKYHRFRIPEGVISETDFLKLLQIYSWYQQSMPTPNHERSTDEAIGLLTRSANL